MAQEAVWGQDVVLSIYVGGSYYPIFCATDCTYQCAAEFIEKTGPESGGARQWMRRLEEHTSTVTGLTKIENGTTVTFFYMLQLAVRRAAQTFKMTFTNENGDEYIINGEGLIGTMGINGPATDWSNATLEIRWNGAPDLTLITDPTCSNIQEPLYLTTTPGASSVSNILLTSSVTILEVQREGIGHTKTTGTPVNREYKFTSATNTISFDSSIPFMTGEIIYVLYAT